MAIRAGQFLHQAGGGFIIDRIQSAGASNINIPEERIWELGNFKAVDIIRDTADLSFDVESFDMSTEMEALIVGIDPTDPTFTDGTAIDFNDYKPLDVIAPFKSANNAYNIAKGIITPYLTLESLTYRFGVRQSSTQQFTFRGDSIFYTPNAPYEETIPLVDNTLTYMLANTAQPYNYGGSTIYVLSAMVKGPSGFKRLQHGLDADYVNTNNSITLATDLFDEGYETLHVTYATAASLSYPQDGVTPQGETVHEGVNIKPGAVRGRDIEVLVTNPNLATPQVELWRGIQTFEVTRRVNLEPDEELGNWNYVSYDYDQAEVSGSINVQSVNLDDLWSKLRAIANVPTTTEVIGPYTVTELEMEVRIRDPRTGVILKTLVVDDARFTIPTITGQVQQKVQTTFPFSSLEGNLIVYKGARP